MHFKGLHITHSCAEKNKCQEEEKLKKRFSKNNSKKETKNVKKSVHYIRKKHIT